jgi:hypothetical protein
MMRKIQKKVVKGGETTKSLEMKRQEVAEMRKREEESNNQRMYVSEFFSFPWDNGNSVRGGTERKKDFTICMEV